MEALGDLCQALGFEAAVRTDPTAQIRRNTELLVVLGKKAILPLELWGYLLGLPTS